MLRVPRCDRAFKIKSGTRRGVPRYLRSFLPGSCEVGNLCVSPASGVVAERTERDKRRKAVGGTLFEKQPRRRGARYQKRDTARRELGRRTCPKREESGGEEERPETGWHGGEANVNGDGVRDQKRGEKRQKGAGRDAQLFKGCFIEHAYTLC